MLALATLEEMFPLLQEQATKVERQVLSTVVEVEGLAVPVARSIMATSAQAEVLPPTITQQVEVATTMAIVVLTVVAIETTTRVSPPDKTIDQKDTKDMVTTVSPVSVRVPEVEVAVLVLQGGIQEVLLEV